MELEHADPVGARRRRRVLITGAGGQLGHALRQAFATDDVLALTHADWDVAQPPSAELAQRELDLVLHTAAWTDVDGAEADPQSAAAVNIGGTAHAAVAARAARDVLDRLRLRRPQALAVRRVGRPEPDICVRSDEAPRRGSSRDTGRGSIRTSWLFGSTGHNFLRTMLRLGAERDEVAVVDDQRGCPTFVGHLAEATRALVDADLPKGLWHVAADGECTWADFAEAIFEEAGLDTRVRRISTAELERPAPRPAYSVLRSERAGAPQLPHWRDGLRACLAEMDG